MFVNQVHFVTKKTTHGADGWCEVGHYVGDKLIAVLTHPCKNAKWFVHGDKGKAAFRRKRDAERFAFDLCVASPEGRAAIEASPEYTEIFCEA